MKLALCLVLVAACGDKSDSKPAPKAVDDKPAPAKVEPKVDPKVEAKPVPKPKVAAKVASDADMKLVSGVGSDTTLHFKPEPDVFLDMTVKQRAKDGKWVTDVTVDGKVIDTIESGVEKDDIHMEVKSAINIAIKEGVLVVVSAIKTTGKPADHYEGRVYAWDSAKKAFTVARTIEFEQVYDPSKDG